MMRPPEEKARGAMAADGFVILGRTMILESMFQVARARFGFVASTLNRKRFALMVRAESEKRSFEAFCRGFILAAGEHEEVDRLLRSLR